MGSKTYRKYPRDVRAVIAASVDTLFRKRPEITRPLDPTSRSDLELRRTWLLIRDELVGRKENQVIERPAR